MIAVTRKDQSVDGLQSSEGSFAATFEAFGEGNASVEDVVKKRSSLQLLDGERKACASIGRMAVQQQGLLSSHNAEPLQPKVPASAASLMLDGVGEGLPPHVPKSLGDRAGAESAGGGVLCSICGTLLGEVFVRCSDCSGHFHGDVACLLVDEAVLQCLLRDMLREL